MNGAAAVPDRSMNRPNSSKMSRIGTSHHFLLWRRKNQNSPRRVLPDSSSAAFSKADFGGSPIALSFASGLTEIACHLGWGRLRFPVRGRAGRATTSESVPAYQFEIEPYRREDAVVKDEQQDPGYQPADRPGEGHQAHEQGPDRHR